ncbi:Zinc finger BED domain-containing [Brachionus plicatilis]|uniref:Zinc finger BED domain-containing n=1 Tax=Brachionus plicatilis TaxID=10195 RepID=A0A3M7PLT2_BRAPC|nr:Zinc finger BED domain-containing [Brachionus plicatilis]
MLKKFFDSQKQSRFEQKDKSDDYIDPLDWWQRKEASFPSLAKIAKKILGIPATTASVERFFSKTGYILRQHRLKMADTLAENLFYLKKNRTCTKVTKKSLKKSLKSTSLDFDFDRFIYVTEFTETSLHELPP